MKWYLKNCELYVSLIQEIILAENNPILMAYSLELLPCTKRFSRFYLEHVINL
jgi:hypothetical protein